MTERRQDLDSRQRYVAQLYRPSEGVGILIYAGDLQLSKDGTSWTAVGDLELRLGSEKRLSARFAGQEPWMFDCAASSDVPEVALPPGASMDPPAQSALPAMPDGVSEWADCDIRINHLTGGNANLSERIILHIVGQLTDWPLPRSLTEYGEQGQLSFALPGWDLRLARANLEPWAETDFTYVIEATPHGLPVSDREIELLIRRVFILLRFVAGGGVGIGPRVGLDGVDRVVWAEWGAPRAEPAGPRWCPDRLVNTALPVLADGLSSVTADQGLEASVDRAVSLLLASNEPGVLDVKIPIACSGLELVGWAVLQHQQWLTPDELGKLTAGARTRLLLQWAKIPIELPAGFTALEKRRRGGKPYLAGPELIFEVRNRVVHPPKRLSDPEWPSSGELFETLQLANWYLELAILRVLGYNDEYVRRLQLTGWAGETETVPWLQSSGNEAAAGP